MERRRTYDTRQKRLVRSVLVQAPDRYFSVDEAHFSLMEAGESVGRTTVYRALEALADDGFAVKVFGPAGGESRYRLAPQASRASGQLLCLGCGRALPLDCGMLDDFAQHVQSHHGFEIDTSRTVLYGQCSDCRSRQPDSSVER